MPSSPNTLLTPSWPCIMTPSRSSSGVTSLICRRTASCCAMSNASYIEGASQSSTCVPILEVTVVIICSFLLRNSKVYLTTLYCFDQRQGYAVSLTSEEYPLASERRQAVHLAQQLTGSHLALSLTVAHLSHSAVG